MPFPRVTWQRQECDDGGEESCHQHRGKTKQSRGAGKAAGDLMVIDGVTSVKPWGRLELSTSIWVESC